VVKNVAGYDLCKLFIGSLGTLGAITQATLKLKPLPEETALVTLGCRAEILELLLDRLHQSRTRPVCLDLVNSPAARAINRRAGMALPEEPWVLVVGFEENREAVGWQVQQLIKELPAAQAGSLDVRIGPPAEPVWRALADFPAGEPGRLTFKANLLPSGTAAFCRQAASLAEGLSLQAHAGNGIVVGRAPADLTLGEAQTMLKTLQDAAVSAQGNVVVLDAPPAWKTALPVWGAPRGDLGLMQAVKDKLDPKRLFNPGRFLPGL